MAEIHDEEFGAEPDCPCCGQEKPLSCPFCGGDGEVVRLQFEDTPPRDKFLVFCEGCGAEVNGTAWRGQGHGEMGFATLPEAVAAWNLRGGRPGGRIDG